MATASASATGISREHRWQRQKVPIIDEYKKILAAYDKRGEKDFGEYERFEFYENAKKCCCILQTGESAIYANIILQKGVI